MQGKDGVASCDILGGVEKFDAPSDALPTPFNS